MNESDEVRKWKLRAQLWEQIARRLQAKVDELTRTPQDREQKEWIKEIRGQFLLDEE